MKTWRWMDLGDGLRGMRLYEGHGLSVHVWSRWVTMWRHGRVLRGPRILDVSLGFVGFTWTEDHQ